MPAAAATPWLSPHIHQEPAPVHCAHAGKCCRAIGFRQQALALPDGWFRLRRGRLLRCGWGGWRRAGIAIRPCVAAHAPFLQVCARPIGRALAVLALRLARWRGRCLPRLQSGERRGCYQRCRACCARLARARCCWRCRHGLNLRCRQWLGQIATRHRAWSRARRVRAGAGRQARQRYFQPAKRVASGQKWFLARWGAD